MAARLTVRLTPRGGRDALDGWAVNEAGRPYLKVRVAAAPTGGEANAALLKLLAEALSTPRSRLQIVSGASARVKTVVVEGLDETALVDRLGGPSRTA